MSALRRLAAHKHAIVGGLGLGLGLIAPTALADKKEESGRPLFDPEALERGAKALREINKSPYAKQVRKLSREPPPKQQQIVSI